MEAKATLGLVQLHGRDAKVKQNAIDAGVQGGRVNCGISGGGDFSATARGSDARWALFPFVLAVGGGGRQSVPEVTMNELESGMRSASVGQMRPLLCERVAGAREGGGVAVETNQELQ